jgi:hypothetical protein
MNKPESLVITGCLTAFLRRCEVVLDEDEYETIRRLAVDEWAPLMELLYDFENSR